MNTEYYQELMDLKYYIESRYNDVTLRGSEEAVLYEFAETGVVL
jgi:hypothetical protein